MPRHGMAATARQWLRDLGFIKPATPQQLLRAEHTVSVKATAAPAPERPVELSPDGDNDATGNDTPVAEPLPAPVVEHQVPVADTTPDTTSTALVVTTEAAAVPERRAELPVAKPNRFVTWLGEVFGLGASSPNDPLRLLAALGVAAVTGVISYDTLQRLAADMGFQDPGAHLFPIGIDLAVFLFTRAWFHRHLSKSTRRSAKWTALFFMAMSVLGNAIEHGKTTYDLWTAARIAALAAHRTWQPGTMDIAWLIVTIVFSALMPLALGLSLHLISQVADDNRRLRDEKAEVAEAPVEQTAAAPPRRRKKPKAAAAPAAAPEPAKAEVDPPAKAENPKPTEVDFSQPTERPDWLTDDMSAKAAMKRYLDLKPNTNGAVLGRWAANYFDIGHDYGRKIKLEWAAEQAKAVSQ